MKILAKKVIYSIFLLSISLNLYASEKCLANVFNTFCLGGDINTLKTRYRDIKIKDDDTNVNTKSVSISRGTKNRSDEEIKSNTEILDRVNYKNINTIYLDITKNKIYRISIHFKVVPIENAYRNGERNIVVESLSSNLISKYGIGDALDYGEPLGKIWRWKTPNYTVQFNDSGNLDFLIYEIPSIAEKVKQSNGL